MSELLRTVAAYVPPYLARATLSADSPVPPTESMFRRFSGAVLYADVSGFTPLTEALGQKGSEGPEELTRLLNRYFSWMIAFIEAESGEVVKFGGDALTVVFPATDEPLGKATRRAMQAAITMQSSMDEFGIMESSVGLITLRMKFGIGAGELMSAQVGGVSNRWEYIITGDALFQATQAEHRAARGEIILSLQAQAIISSENLPPKLMPLTDWNSIDNPDEVEAVLRSYIPKPVLTWLGETLHGWLATLRPMSVLFVGIKGLDYEQPGTIEQLHTFAGGAQEIIYHYQGSLPRLTVDDKGTVLLILFGAPPYSHEDDPERAVRCALDLQALAKKQRLKLSIGVTTGRVFAGPVGGFTRREYTVMGDTVNLAARLMSIAGAGNIRCNHQTYRSTYGQISFKPLAPTPIKGKTEPIQTYQPTGNFQITQKFEQLEQLHEYLSVVGRQGEIEKLVDHLDAVQDGESRIVIIEGEAGIGKSQIVKELIQYTNRFNLATLIGIGRSIEHNSPYQAWQHVFATYFGSNSNGNLDKLLPQIETDVKQAAPHLLQYLPLLNDIIGLKLSENEHTMPLDSVARSEKLAQLVLTLLQAQSTAQPQALIIEDAQWLDSFSWNLTMRLGQAIVEHKVPLLLVLVTRPFTAGDAWLKVSTLATLPQAEHLRIDTLSLDETLTLVTQPIGLTSHELPEAVAELIRRRAGGNPFFAEEIFYFLHNNGFISFKMMQNTTRCLVSGDLDRAAQTLPATIQNTILARIDQLPPEKQLLLKVAAVIGQIFAYSTLRDTLRQHLEIDEPALKQHLNDLTYLGFILPGSEETESTYSFKHIIIREVTYQSLLFDRRRELHRTVARWYEGSYRPEMDRYLAGSKSDSNPNLSLSLNLPSSSTPLSPYFSLLVYHWHQAEDEEKEQFYAALVGELAVAQYANAEAIGYLSRALDLTPTNNLRERYKLFLARETIYNRHGDRDRQVLDLGELIKLAEKMDNSQRKAVVALRYARYCEATGNYDEGLKSAKSAVAHARQAQNPAGQSEGFMLWGKILWRRGEFEPAQTELKNGLQLAREHNIYQAEAEILYNLATICWLQGQYPETQTCCQKMLTLCRMHDLPVMEAFCSTLMGQIEYRLGNYQAARKQFEYALPAYYAVGNRRGELTPLYSIGLIHAISGQHEAARDYYELALDNARQINDKEGMAETLTRLGILFANMGDYAAAQGYLGQALGIRKEIGNQQGEADSLSRFARIYFNLGEYRTTQRYCELALAIQQKIGDLEGEAYVQTYLGHVLRGLKEYSEAEKAYQRALQLRQEMGQNSVAINAKTGLCRLRLAQGKSDEAQLLAEEVLGWIHANGLAGIIDPFWVYLKIYQTLQTIGDDNPAAKEQARQVLEAAHQALQQAAAKFSDGRLHRRFLSRVKSHQEIIASWEGRDFQSSSPDQAEGKTREKFLE